MRFGMLVFGSLSDLLPSSDQLDSVIVTAGNFALPLATGLASLGAWIPWATVGVCLAALFPVYLGSLLFKLVRVIWGYVPFIGGNG